MAELFQLPLLFGEPLETTHTASSFTEKDTRAAVQNGSPTPDFASEIPPPDLAEREDALDIRRSWIVEAPAGSGKTGLLIQRLLKLLADETVAQPEEVLAITFTRAASEEIRDRVLSHLEAARDSQPSPSTFDRATRELARQVLEHDRQLGWDLLGNPRRLNIRTIDSVCIQIRNGLPVLSGGAGNLQTTEDADDLYREAARNILLRLGGPDQRLNQALGTVLSHRDGDLRNCENLLSEMLRLREQWGDFLPIEPDQGDDEQMEREARARLDLALEQMICAELGRLEIALPQDLLQSLTQAAADLSDRPGYNGAASPLAACRNRYASPASRIADLEHWRTLLHLLVKSSDVQWRGAFSKNHLGFQTDRPDRERLRALVTTAQQTPGLLAAIKRASKLPPARYPEEQWVVARALFRVLREALVELRIVFARHHRCDFAESALQARAALRAEVDRTDLRAALGLELRHLLVDEMQDTSSGQYELICLLTQQWSGDRRTLFLVGDPKQSIYLFRQARVERFLRTMREKHLGSLTLGVLRLTANFRSQASLVDSFNQDFLEIFPQAAHPTQDAAITFTPVQAARRRASAPGAGRRWHTQILPTTPSSPMEAANAKRYARQRHAHAIRDIIADWRSRPLPPGRSTPWRIAVLVRARQHLFEIVSALRGTPQQSAIPYRAIKVESLGDRPEILDLLSLTRALLHPADRISWLSILRAPWCGLELAELHQLTGADDLAFQNHLIETLIEARGPLLSTASAIRLAHVARVLRSAIAQRDQLPLAQLVERTWRSLGGPLALTDTQQINAAHFFSLLDELEGSTGRIPLPRLIDQVKRLYAEPSVDADAVDLMTIHQAKGLEWDVVLVPALERVTTENNSRLLTWEEIDTPDKQAAHVLLAPIHGRGEPARALNRWLAELAKSREAEERKRLFYVACTRAREELHLFATVDNEMLDRPSPGQNSLLSAAWPAARLHLRHATEDPDYELHAPVSTESPESTADETAGFLDLAASAEASAEAARLFRLPDGLEIHPSSGSSEDLPRSLDRSAVIDRPEGSLLARSFGTVVHDMLEWLANERDLGQSPNDLLNGIPAWRGRISALLRSGGVPTTDLPHLTRDVQSALGKTLTHAAGLWLLEPRSTAASELSLTSKRDHAVTLRVDRLFVAGNEPLSEGDRCLWIVDYKTATHGRNNQAHFLDDQRSRYAAQLENYAHHLHGLHDTTHTCVALYFPMLAQLVWWRSSPSVSASSALDTRSIMTNVSSSNPENHVLRDVRGVISDPFEIA